MLSLHPLKAALQLFCLCAYPLDIEYTANNSPTPDDSVALSRAFIGVARQGVLALVKDVSMLSLHPLKAALQLFCLCAYPLDIVPERTKLALGSILDERQHPRESIDTARGWLSV
jgi:hypothetical protein